MNSSRQSPVSTKKALAQIGLPTDLQKIIGRPYVFMRQGVEPTGVHVLGGTILGITIDGLGTISLFLSNPSRYLAGGFLTAKPRVRHWVIVSEDYQLSEGDFKIL